MKKAEGWIQSRDAQGDQPNAWGRPGDVGDLEQVASLEVCAAGSWEYKQVNADTQCHSGWHEFLMKRRSGVNRAATSADVGADAVRYVSVVNLVSNL